MSKILSQEEIDALLSSSTTTAHAAVSTEPVDRRPIITYDFKHPNRISKDQIRTLESVHSSFAGKLASALSGMLRSVVDVDVLSVDQITYAEFVNSLSSPSCTATFSMKPLEGQSVIDVSPTLTFAFVDRIFGGRGEPINADREMTGIETSVMHKIFERAYRELADAWARLCKVEITGEVIETTPQFIQVVPSNEIVIVAALQLKMAEVTGVCTFCYPYITLEPVIANLSGQSLFAASKTQASGNDHREVEGSLRHVQTDVSVVLARAEITMREFLSIDIGDVIMTDADIVTPARVCIGGVQKFLARPGMRGRRRALEILSVVTED